MNGILGTVRQLDKLGRLVLPKEPLRVLGIEPEESFAVERNGESIILTATKYIENDSKKPNLIRNMDDLGRIVIPMQFRRGLGLNAEDKIETVSYRNG